VGVAREVALSGRRSDVVQVNLYARKRITVKSTIVGKLVLRAS
jgi:hypothetical protein